MPDDAHLVTRCASCPVAASLACPATARRHSRYCALHEADPGAWGLALVSMAEEAAIPKAPLPLPAAWRRALNFALAVLRDLAGGMRRLRGPAVAARLAICAGCPSLRPDRRCAQCGCPVARKARYASERCPLGRWPRAGSAELPPMDWPKTARCGCGG